MAGFNLYVDEAGDEGFVFRGPSKGSSEWFVLSGVVTRSARDHELVAAVASIRAMLGKPPLFPLHFRHLTHNHRLGYINAVAKIPMRAIAVLVHKPSIRERERFKQKDKMYFYMARYLFERVSWLCRDVHRKLPSQDGTVQVFMSNRSNMAYGELRNYIDMLLANATALGVRIEPGVIVASQIDTRLHSQLAGLQVADAVASSFFTGVKKNDYGLTEPRFALMLKDSLYAHEKVRMSYGIKLWPGEASSVAAADPQLAWIARAGA